MKKIILSLFLIFITTLSHAANCGDGVGACSCGDTLTADYTLTGNLSCTNAGACLTIGGNNIDLDLGGFTIDGDDTNTTTCINIVNKTGITVSNGTVTDCTEDGIQMTGGTTATITNVTANSHGNQGFQVQNTAVVTLNGVTANNNTDDGLSAHDNCTVTLEGAVTFSGNDQGINIIDGATVNGDAYIALSNNTTYGIWVVDSMGSGETSTFTNTNTTTITATSGSNIYVGGGAAHDCNVNLKAVDLQGTGLTYNIYARGAGTVTIDGGSMTASPTSARDLITAVESANLVLKGGLTLNPGACDNIIYTTGGTVTMNEVFVSGTNAVDHLIDLDTGSGPVLISHCFFYNIPAKYSIVIRGGISTELYNNVFFDTYSSPNGSGIFCDNTPVGAKNNILAGLATAVYVQTGDTWGGDYNCFYDNTANSAGSGTFAVGANSVTTDPKMVSPATNNFKITKASSCYNTGTKTSVFANGDGDQYDGNGILVWDDTTDAYVGAYKTSAEIGGYGVKNVPYVVPLLPLLE